MDNKKWSKRFSTIFWWMFALLPLFVALIQFIGFHLTFNSGISSSTDLADYHNSVYGVFYNILSDNLSSFSGWIPSFLVSAWSGLFDFFNINNSVLNNLLSWMSFSFLIHVVFDIVVWLPKWLHCWLSKYDS